jgi:hypothetical protein
VNDDVFSPGDRSPAAVVARRQAIRAEALRRHRSGTFGAFSDEEMDRARDLTHYAGPPPAADPIVELLGHPADVTTEEAEARWEPRVLSSWPPRSPGPSYHSRGHTPAAPSRDEIDRALREAASLTARTLVANFEKSMAAVKAMAAAIDLEEMRVKVAAMAEDDPPPDVLNSKRHGAAAVCPRHGMTKGGLCRRCQR